MGSSSYQNSTNARNHAIQGKHTRSWLFHWCEQNRCIPLQLPQKVKTNSRSRLLNAKVMPSSKILQRYVARMVRLQLNLQRHSWLLILHRFQRNIIQISIPFKLVLLCWHKTTGVNFSLGSIYNICRLIKVTFIVNICLSVMLFFYFQRNDVCLCEVKHWMMTRPVAVTDWLRYKLRLTNINHQPSGSATPHAQTTQRETFKRANSRQGTFYTNSEETTTLSSD